MPKNENQPTFRHRSRLPQRSRVGGRLRLDRDWRPGLAGFRGRALNESGLIYEKDGCSNLPEAMAALEKGLGKWFQENG